MSLIVLALASGGSLLELAGDGSDLLWDSCLALLTEATHTVPHATKILPYNPNTA